MDEEYTFQPQLNTRSRRLARHAPTLRERQEQEEQLRRSASRVSPDEQRRPRSRPQQRHSESPQRKRSAPRDSDPAASVWALWRAVAAGEGRDEERAYVSAVSSTSECLPRPPVVHVSTVLAMLKALGLHAAQHAALVDKFLAALGVAGESDDDEDDLVVEAERFAHVFTTVWRAAVTNSTRWSPAPARSASPATAPVTRSAERSAVPPPARAEVAATTPAVEAPVECASHASSTASSSSSEEEETSNTSDDSESDDASFLHTNMSRTPSSEAASSPDTKPTQRPPSPLSPGETPGLSLSPEPRNPQTPPVVRAISQSTTRYGRSPFSTTPAPLRSAASASMRRQDGQRSTPRVLASDSHLLATTASCERKKSAKREPGGLMRECTFAPKINDAPPSFAERRQARCTTHAEAASPSFQPNTQQFHRERAKLAWWTERADGAASCDGGAERSPVPLAPGFDTAVRRMIAARQQQQQRDSLSAPRVAKRASAVRMAEAPLVYVDVDLPRGEAGRIALFRGADVAALAHEFAAQHRLDDRLRDRLEDALRTQLQAHS